MPGEQAPEGAFQAFSEIVSLLNEQPPSSSQVDGAGAPRQKEVEGGRWSKRPDFADGVSDQRGLELSRPFRPEKWDQAGLGLAGEGRAAENRKGGPMSE